MINIVIDRNFSIIVFFALTAVIVAILVYTGRKEGHLI